MAKTTKSGPDRPREPSVRSVPKQARSKRRYAAIVDAAALLFADHGFEATTTEAIAAAAETSIGSVYRFFPDKRAIFRAVAERAMARVDELFAERIVASITELEWHELLGRAIAVFTHLHEHDPASRALLANTQLYDEYQEADEAQLRRITDVTEGIIGLWAPTLDAETRAVVATMVVETIFGIIVLGQRQSPARREAMVEHLELMLRRYLEPWIADRGFAKDSP